MADNRPNILLVMTDQQRGDCLGIEDHPVLQTPNLDYMAASGVRFRHAYSACPVCVPARRTVITGRKPSNHGALQNASAPLPWPTLPGVLRDAGYRTHLAGKAHWGRRRPNSGLTPRNGRTARSRASIMIIRGTCGKTARRGTALPMPTACPAMDFQDGRGTWTNICILPTGACKKGSSLSTRNPGTSRGFSR